MVDLLYIVSTNASKQFLASFPLFPGDVSYGIVLFIIITDFQSFETSCSREMTSNDNISCIVKSQRAEALQNLTRLLRFDH